MLKGYGSIPGCITLETIEDAKPVIENIIQKEVKNTEWVSNNLLEKKNNSFRICLDPAVLNGTLKRPHLQFTTLEAILPEIGQATVFSTVHTRKGFWHLKLSEESSKLTTFWTPFVRYRWLRLLFGKQRQKFSHIRCKR